MGVGHSSQTRSFAPAASLAPVRLRNFCLRKRPSFLASRRFAYGITDTHGNDKFGIIGTEHRLIAARTGQKKTVKEGIMRILSMFFCVVAVASMFLAGPVHSATVYDLVGTWTTVNTARIKVAGIGSWSSTNSSTVTLGDDETFTLDEIDSTGDYNYTGTWALINNGKKIAFQLDGPGYLELQRVWANWFRELAYGYGATIDDISFWDITYSISQPGVPKKTNIPKKATIKARGWVSARLNGESISKKFSYTSKVYFLVKQ